MSTIKLTNDVVFDSSCTEIGYDLNNWLSGAGRWTATEDCWCSVWTYGEGSLTISENGHQATIYYNKTSSDRVSSTNFILRKGQTMSINNGSGWSIKCYGLK